MRDLEGKVFAVTGAASGIGRAIACALSREGVKLALGDINEAGLAETSAALGNAHHFTRRLDVRDRDAVFAFAEKTVENFGHADGVINNAGVTVVAPFEDTSPDDFEWVMDINFWGVVHGSQAFLPRLKARDEAVIVNISSVFGLIGFPAQSAYNASKFAVRGITEALRHELEATAPHVTAISVHPGGIKTPIARNARFRSGLDAGASHEQAIRSFEKAARTSPEAAAETIIDGIKAKRPRVLIGRDARMIDRIQRLLPARYFKILSGAFGD